MLVTAAGWIAPAATMIAAMMTAANLGARVTGWGFVVFTVGAVGWIVTALATGQRNLLIANAFLLLIDLVGIWRWLGRQARYDDGAKAATEASAKRAAPTLFALGTLAGKPVLGEDGEAIAATVDGMAAYDDGRIAYLVVRAGGVGGVGEELHALGWDEVVLGEQGFTTAFSGEALKSRPALETDRWPATAEAAGVC